MQPVDDRCVSCAPLGERASHRLVELASVVEDVCFPRGIDAERHRAGTKECVRPEQASWRVSMRHLGFEP